MKIVSWNLKNIGQTKLANTFSAVVNGFGIGNSVLDFMLGLVMGSDRWNNVPGLSQNPADIFVVIELKSGGNRKGYAVSGTAIPTMNAILAAMNTAAFNRYGNNNNYYYNYVVPPAFPNANGPLVTGYHETVGIIYNTRSLTYNAANAFRNGTNQQWINPRTPYGGRFEFVAHPGTFINIIGIHAPPPSGAAAIRYRAPINYCNLLYTVWGGGAMVAGLPNTFFMGDFNCNPGSSYERNAGGGMVDDVFPFEGLVGYNTFIPDGTLSSMKTKIAKGAAAPYPQTSYLNDAYDNIMFSAPLNALNTNQLVVDMVGRARNRNAVPVPTYPMQTGPYATSNAMVTAYNRVSDHLPVVIEW